MFVTCWDGPQDHYCEAQPSGRKMTQMKPLHPQLRISHRGIDENVRQVLLSEKWSHGHGPKSSIVYLPTFNSLSSVPPNCDLARLQPVSLFTITMFLDPNPVCLSFTGNMSLPDSYRIWEVGTSNPACHLARGTETCPRSAIKSLFTNSPLIPVRKVGRRKRCFTSFGAS
jgi:hypothetical protein